jgi:hypothetical protein
MKNLISIILLAISFSVFADGYEYYEHERHSHHERYYNGIGATVVFPSVYVPPVYQPLPPAVPIYPAYRQQQVFDYYCNCFKVIFLPY